jgi:hypothetical protein
MNLTKILEKLLTLSDRVTETRDRHLQACKDFRDSEDIAKLCASVNESRDRHAEACGAFQSFVSDAQREVGCPRDGASSLGQMAELLAAIFTGDDAHPLAQQARKVAKSYGHSLAPMADRAGKAYVFWDQEGYRVLVFVGSERPGS